MNQERQCNECTLCCKLLPVSEINKKANTRCVHQRSLRGCMIYHQDKFPLSCRQWSCVWLLDPSIPNLARPDRAHYVIDPTPDYVTVGNTHISVVQIWVDPNHRHAHRDPALRSFLLERFTAFGQLGIVRFNSTDAIVLLPPPFTPNGEWIEHEAINADNRAGNQKHYERDTSE